MPQDANARGQVGALLTRMGQPEKGLETLRETIRSVLGETPARANLSVVV